jgi:uncharacterized protein with ParB-like and HNH nuclease domain
MELQTLDDLFGKYSFETPDYQRGFAWGTEQVKDFWDDISRIGITNPQHFTGTLILEAVPDAPSRATVVDGQQRLTTVVLLAAAIAEDLERRGRVEEGAAFRKSFLGDANNPSFKYAVAHDSWPYLALHAR